MRKLLTVFLAALIAGPVLAQSTGGGGGSGTPGGANTNVQYNNSGSFGGNASFTYDGNGDITMVPAAGGTSGPYATTTCTATGSQAPLCGLNITGFSLNTTGNPDGWILHASGALTACASNCYEIDIPGFTLNQLGAAGFSGTITTQSNLVAVGNVNFQTGLVNNGTLLCSSSAPTISSGFGTSPSIVSSNGTCSFQVNVGTGGTATSGVIGLPTAAHGWVCAVTDITTNSTTVFVTKQTASSTTSCTVGNFSDVAAAAAWAASDKLNVIATAN